MNEPPRLPYGHQSLDAADIEAVVAALGSDWLTTGPAVAAFETALAEAAGTRDAVAVSSGTAALHAAYAAVGLGPGEGIVTSPLTFAATATAALHLGARVRFADVGADTGNLDPEAAESALADDTRLLVPTDYAGHPADYAALGRLAASRGLAIIADAAHSFGAGVDGAPATALADAATLSFHPVKLITTAEGGAVVTSRAGIADAARRFRNHGIVREPERLRQARPAPHYYEIQSLGLNYRLPDVLCALGSSQLGKLGIFLERRRSIAARYSAAFVGLEAVELPTVAANVTPAWHLYVIRVRDAARRDPLFAALTSAGLGVQVHYPPVHLHPLFEAMGHRAGEFPVAEDFARRAISLPLFPGMTDADVERVIETVQRSVRNVL